MRFQVWARRRLAGQAGLVPVEVPVRFSSGVIGKGIRWKLASDIKPGEKELGESASISVGPGKLPEFTFDSLGFPEARRSLIHNKTDHDEFGEYDVYEHEHGTMKIEPEAVAVLGGDAAKIAQAFSIPGHKVELEVFKSMDGAEVRGKLTRIINHPPLDPVVGIVGKFTRTFVDPGTAHGTVTHDNLDIDTEYQRQGIGHNLLANSIAFYKDLGIKEVHLEAGLSAGRVVWAKMGFDFANRPARIEAGVRFKSYLMERGYTPQVADAVYASTKGEPWNMVRVEDEAGNKLGEDFFDGGPVWSGVLPIDNNDAEGWKVFRRKVYGT